MKQSMSLDRYAGFGIGLRPQHFDELLNQPTNIDWFEIVTEDYLATNGRGWHVLNQLRERHPIAMHGVSLSIGGSDALDWEYLKQVKKLAEQIQPLWISDHVCWTGVDGINTHDLLPLPMTAEALTHIVNRIDQVQTFFQQPILLENVSSYVQFQADEFSEWAFLNEITRRSGCYLLLDINNVYVNASNHGFSAEQYIDEIHPSSVRQYHLAGHLNKGSVIIDTHADTIINEVWRLYQQACSRFGDVATLVEWDDDIPSLSMLKAELEQARKVASVVA